MARAREVPSVIINADSMQVYRDLQILTARPSQEDEAEVPHRLFGHADGAEAYSTGRYVRYLASLLDEARGSGLRPIIVGGTGLYFRAILEGLSPVPEIPAEIRAHWRRQQAEAGTAEVYRQLEARDGVMAARLKPTDPQRIVRALEVLDATGRSLAQWQAEPGTPLLEADACERVVVSPPREIVFARADQRFDAMVAAGAVAEVEHLLARGLDPGLPVMRALGVPQLARFVSGEATLAAAVAEAKADTRAYIKRQRTWLKRNMTAWIAVDAQ
jgi:tRNA dimethylallyltransferase